MKTRTVKNGLRVLGMAAAVCAFVMSAAPAQALSLPGNAAKRISGQDGCFSEYNGGIDNECGSAGAPWVQMPFAVNEGYHTVNVTTYNNGGQGNFYCVLSAHTSTGSVSVGTAHYPVVGYETFGLSVTVPSNGAMYMNCSMNVSSRIMTVNYSQ
jgi:hypothetical protein